MDMCGRGLSGKSVVNMEDWKVFSNVYWYIVNKTYAEGTPEDEKWRGRENAQAFAAENGILYHRNSNNLLLVNLLSWKILQMMIQGPIFV